MSRRSTGIFAAIQAAPLLLIVGATVMSADAHALPSVPSTAEVSTTALLPLAPDFTVTDLSGRALSLSGYRGKVVLLIFWATWCGPCLAEIPTFVQWHRKYASEGLQILGVSMDEDSAKVKRALSKYHIGYPVIMGDEHLGQLYGGVLGLPLSYLIDPAGRIAARYQGESDPSEMEARIRRLLRR